MIRIRECLFSGAAMCMVIAACEPVDETEDPFGYQRLRQELGAAAPDGNGVAVHLVEASQEVTEEVDGVERKIGTGFAPNVGILEFSGKDIEVTPGIFTHHSGHTTGIGRKFFGNETSTSPGITDIHAFESMTWVGKVLNLGRNRLPESSKARVANHSWVGSADHPELPGTRNLQVLRRLDWLVATDDFIQVVGFSGNEESPLLSSASNVIAVSHREGEFHSGSAPVWPGDYPVGRPRPDLVVPELNPSSATARVSSAAALLVQAGHADASLSTDPAGASVIGRHGDTIFNAERSEVIKAALMAGADPVISNPNDFGAEPTANGLDRRYGAGDLNIYNSYRIIAAGESNSVEDEPGVDGAISEFGFDYDPSFGGVGERNAQGTYFFATSADSVSLTATLAWNARVPTGRDLAFDAVTKVLDLDLLLYDVADADRWVPVAVSAARIGNTENIRVPLAPHGDYALRVEMAPGQQPFEWDYGLAWRIEPQTGPQP